MVMRLIDPESPIRWIHPDERGDPKNATVFHILPLSEGALRKIMAAHPTRISGGAGTMVETTMDEDEIRFDTFMSQVPQIDNVQWPGAATTINITKPEERARFYDMMPAKTGKAIHLAIQNTALLTEGDAKNFEGSSD